MIRFILQGDYELWETKPGHKILRLDNNGVFAWIHVSKEMYEILVTTHKDNGADHILASSKYRLYEVTDEKQLTSQKHLELMVGEGKWQGYLMPTGLPTQQKIRSRIIPTKELITKAIPYQPPDSSFSKAARSETVSVF